MGNCLTRLCRSSDDDYDDHYLDENSDDASSKIVRLIEAPIKWRSSQPLSESRLLAKRQEFWETAPMFDGQPEMWTALRAAAQHAENGDYQMAQAIVDSAGCVLVDGTLREIYDEKGRRYLIPVYCLSRPTNCKNRKNSSNSNNNETSRASKKKRIKNKKLNINEQQKNIDVLLRSGQNVKFRSAETMTDVTIRVPQYMRIEQVKYDLYRQHSNLFPINQRWIYLGRVLSDKTVFKTVRYNENFVILVYQRKSNQNYSNAHDIITQIDE